MAKGKGQTQLQIEVETDEEWNSLVLKEGLIVVDIYSEWCGPCNGMTGNLRKLKLEQGGDTLILATAKSDNIQCLSRFRNKSRPTWMFISNQRMLRLLFGANAPMLTKIILEELQHTKISMETKTPRTGINYDQLTEDEQEIADKEQEEKEEQDRIEREAREKAINERREAIVENLLEPLKEYNFVVVWPHVKSDGVQQIMSTIKDLGVSTVGKPIKHQITQANLHEIFYYANWKYNELEITELCNDEITGLLFSFAGAEGDEIIHLFLEKLYGPSKCPPGHEDFLAMKLSKEKKMPKPPPTQEESSSEDKSIKSILEDSKSLIMSLDPEKQNSEEQTFLVPAVYVPENENCKVLAMRILFPAVTMKFDLPEPEPIPPHLILAFDAFKKAEIMQLAEEYPKETMFLGFFTSILPEQAKLICKTVDQYEKLVPRPVDAKLIVQVAKTKSEPLLSFSSLGPLYISPNSVIGEREAAIFFPEGYNEPEQEPEPEIHRKSKKKKKSRIVKVSLTQEEEGISSPKDSEDGVTKVEEEDEEGEEDDENEEGEDDMGDDDEDGELIGEFELGDDKATATEATPEP